MDSSSWKRKRPALKERGSVWPHGRSSGRDRGRGSRDSGEEGVYGLSKAEADIGPPRLEAHKNALSAHTHTGTHKQAHTHRDTQRGTVWWPCVRKGGNARRQNFY